MITPYFSISILLSVTWSLTDERLAYTNRQFETFSATLHTAAEPAVRAPVKTELSYRNDSIIAFFFSGNKNKDNTEVVLASCNSLSLVCIMDLPRNKVMRRNLKLLLERSYWDWNYCVRLTVRLKHLSADQLLFLAFFRPLSKQKKLAKMEVSKRGSEYPT